jgi:histidyl-tRNA synthetase
MPQRTFQAPKGTRDFYPADLALRRHVEAAWRSASVDFGFDEVEGPTFEHLELYTVKSGPGIVSELFSFRRAGGDDDYALRPEFTPTLARMVAARGGSLPVPVKWFAIPNFFRAERPQRGRLREFTQWNVDLLGLDTPDADAEVIAVAALALERLGLRPADVRIKLSHRGAMGAALGAMGVKPDQVAGAFELLDRRDRLEPAAIKARAAEIGLTDAALESLMSAAATRIPLEGGSAAIAKALGIGAAGLEAIDALHAALGARGIAEWCEWDLGIVRGLAYYTGSVFEIHEASGAERAIAGGGRYDGLVELVGGPKTSAFGFGMGDVVLSLVLKDRGLLPADGGESLLPRPDVFLISADPSADPVMHRLAAELRRAGLHVRHSYKATRNVGKLLGDAGKCHARRAVILDAGLASGQVSVKDLDGGSQSAVAMTDLVATLTA